jgi:predicted GH43/DUF377 family glycosyl hydrolase
VNLVQKSVLDGGRLIPLTISKGLTNGTGLMNPSVFIDDNEDILVVLRHVNYTLYHSENTQKFPSVWGPLAYLHPEKDLRLVTTNYLMRLDKNFKIINFSLIDTEMLDSRPLWDFVGLEDARLFKWEEKYYISGVRRDTTPDGQGRMELSEIEIDRDSWTVKEVKRFRIPAPNNNDSYCEKNWMPVLDKPYHYVKWTSPTELVKTSLDLPAKCEQIFVKQGLESSIDLRGGSQVINWGKYYIAIVHETISYFNYLNQKDGIYRHRVVVWDKNFKLIGISPSPFSFLDAKIEFVAGAAKFKNDLLISFGFQDNAAFILKTPKKIVDEMIKEALSYGTN